jgi:hypothetical protein
LVHELSRLSPSRNAIRDCEEVKIMRIHYAANHQIARNLNRAATATAVGVAATLGICLGLGANLSRQRDAHIGVESEYEMCVRNMSRLHRAIDAYAHSHDGRFPASLDDLVRSKLVSSDYVFRCPTTGAAYVYSGSELTLKNPADAVVFYELDTPHVGREGDSMLLCLKDGRIRALDTAEGMKLLAGGQQASPRK